MVGGNYVFLLCLEQYGEIVIKSGFSFGYYGEGFGVFVEVFFILMVVNVEIDELEVLVNVLKCFDMFVLIIVDVDCMINV